MRKVLINFVKLGFYNFLHEHYPTGHATKSASVVETSATKLIDKPNVVCIYTQNA